LLQLKKAHIIKHRLYNGSCLLFHSLDHFITKKIDVVQVYLSQHTNCLSFVFDHCLRSWHYLNVVVAGSRSLTQWLRMDGTWCVAQRALEYGNPIITRIVPSDSTHKEKELGSP
jgi:phosphoketolase